MLLAFRTHCNNRKNNLFSRYQFWAHRIANIVLGTFLFAGNLAIDMSDFFGQANKIPTSHNIFWVNHFLLGKSQRAL